MTEQLLLSHAMVVCKGRKVLDMTERLSLSLSHAVTACRVNPGETMRGPAPSVACCKPCVFVFSVLVEYLLCDAAVQSPLGWHLGVCCWSLQP